MSARVYGQICLGIATQASNKADQSMRRTLPFFKLEVADSRNIALIPLSRTASIFYLIDTNRCKEYRPTVSSAETKKYEISLQLGVVDKSN